MIGENQRGLGEGAIDFDCVDKRMICISKWIKYYELVEPVF